MQQNAILTFFKLVAFTVLAVMVFFTFWQANKAEDRTTAISRDVKSLLANQGTAGVRQRERDAAIDTLSGRIDALTSVVETMIEHGVAARPAQAGSSGPAAGTSTTPSGRQTGPVKKTGLDGTKPPAYLSAAAKALWGTYPNYLEEQTDGIPLPDWETPGLDPSGRFHRWYGSAPSSINPITGNDGSVRTHIEQYCMDSIGLQHDRNPSKYAPALAVRVEVNAPDYTQWVVFLRKGVKWHRPQVDLDRYPHLAGEHFVTAADIKFSVDARKNEHARNAHIRSYYDQCEGVEIIDDHCCIVHWKKPQFNSISFTLAMPIVPRFILAYDEQGKEYESEEDLGQALNDHWFYRAGKYVGCGPYTMAEYDSSSHFLLRRFEEYYGDLPRIREIHEEIVASQELNLKGFEARKYDATTLTPKQWDLKTQNKSPDNPFTNGAIETNWWWTPRYAFIGWNNDHPIFSDVDVRHAMTMACNRDRLRDVIYLGRAKTVTGPQPPNTPFYPPDIEPLPFDLERAKARLEAAGWRDTNGNGTVDKVIDGELKEFKFKATIPAVSETFTALFSIFREDLSTIGVDMEIESLQWKQFIEQIRGSRKFECTALVWGGSGWEGDLYQIWHSDMADEVGSSNYISFRDQQLDDMIIEARGVFEHEKRVELKRKMHRRLHELQPYTFLMAYQLAMVSWKDRVGNARAMVQYRTRPVWRMFPGFVKK